MFYTVSLKGDGAARFAEMVTTLGEKRTRVVYRRAINEAGRDLRAPTFRALAGQTGLRINVTRRALRVSPATAEKLEYRLTGRGGDIGLKYFGAREVRSGVSAAPFGKRRIFDVHFIRGGLFPKRKTLPLGGHVFRPHRLRFKRSWGRPIEKAKSGVYIPKEMAKGATLETFERLGPSKLAEKVERHLRLVTKGVLT